MLPQRSHITRKRGVYYYRRRLPSGLGGELALSLWTRNYRHAEYWAIRLDRLFARTLSMTQDRTKIAAILRQELAEWIARDEAIWLRTPAGEPAYAIWGAPGEEARQADIETTEGWLSEARGDARRRDFAGVEEAVDMMIAEHGLTKESRHELAFGLVQVRIKMLEARLERLRGEGPDILGEPTERTTIPIAQPVSLASPPPPAGPLLSTLLPDFLDVMTEHQGWRGQTRAQNGTTYDMFISHCGDHPIQHYAKRELTSFYDVLRNLPALYAKKAEWRDLPLKEIVERTQGEDIERLTMKTVKRHFSALGRLFTYFKKRGEYEGENPAHGFEFPMKGRANEGRKVWSSDGLKKLFSSPVFTGCFSEHRRSRPGDLIIKDERYWLPILGLYHGNRLEEFAQLRREDVRCENNIWYFNITDDGERHLKNAQSRRRVPIHPVVLGLGFVEYVAQTAPNPTDLVFPLLNPGGPDKKLGFYFTKWFSSYRKDIGVYEKLVDYHSFRHGVTTKLYEAEVEEALIDELTGHEGQGTSRKVYKKQMPLPVLLKAISKVEWPEVQVGLSDGNVRAVAGNPIGAAAPPTVSADK